MLILQILFWLIVAAIGYVYLGYPLVLLCLRAVLGQKNVAIGPFEPPVTLLISAFNEERVIEGKIRNSLDLDYPPESLDLIVISDNSMDATDEIVARFSSRGVRLLRMSSRGGKTLGLNEGVRQARGDVIVFSDANAMYKRDAIRQLVRNLADPTVGAVVGESTYAPAANDAEHSEVSYWSYESALKRLETALGSVVGGDGAIYAVRKSLYRDMPADALSDFVNPLEVVQQGYRCVYEPAAVSVEAAAGEFEKEFKRKVRIVNRAWRAALRLKVLMNPFRHGLFSLQLISHKVLRWWVPVLMLALLLVTTLVARTHTLYSAAFYCQVVFYGLSFAGFVARRYFELPRVLALPMYFCLVNLAALKGIAEVYAGKSYTTWSTARAD